MPDSKGSLLRQVTNPTQIDSTDSLVGVDHSASETVIYRADAIAGRVIYPTWNGTNWKLNQSTKPTLRPDGSALVNGDRWIDTTDGREWRWTSPYWLSIETFPSQQFVTTATTMTYANACPSFGTGLWIESLELKAQTGTAHDASNFYSCQFGRHTGSNAFDVGTAISTATLASGNPMTFLQTVGLYLSNADILYWRTAFTATGTPAVTRFNAQVIARIAR